MARPVVTGLHVNPVKSCAGTPLREAENGPRGIVHDRRRKDVRRGGERRRPARSPVG